ncbi:transposase, partial [Burkholderia ubonensis]|uniref:transposase n=1 Tax=Burkholderia ubonensis TaxID=101571 RepID=UPI000AC52857
FSTMLFSIQTKSYQTSCCTWNRGRVTPYQQGVSGQSQTYSEAYLELIFIFYRLVDWGMRQSTSHMQEFWALRGLDIGVPTFGLLSERFRTLKVHVKQRCQRVAEGLSRGETISLRLIRR